jgi:NADPH2:quinone reductase
VTDVMRAHVLTAFGGPECLETLTVPKPIPKSREVLVRVCATAVNPVDYQTRRGDYRDEIRLPAVIGADVSGVVEAVGDAVTEFGVGDEVFYSPVVFGEHGSYGEYAAADAAIVARKPAALSHVEACCFPCAGGTAWDCLVTRGAIRVGETVLVHAGAGGVGSIAIQLAKAAGAYVFTTASERNLEFVRELGADRAIDHRNEDFAEVVDRETAGAGVDLVLDTVGGETIVRSVDVLRPLAGRIVTIVDTAHPLSLLEAWGRNVALHFVFTPQYRARLDGLATLIDRGLIRPVIDSVLPWEQIVEAHERLERGGLRGKIVLRISDA